MHIDALRIAAAAFKAALQQQDRQALLAAARRLIALDAPLGGQWPELAEEVFRWGELDLALEALNAWHRQGTPANVVNYEKATLLARTGQTGRAIKLADAVPVDFPTPVANAYLRGALATNMADPGEAAVQFRRAVEARADSGRSWQGIAQLGKLTESDIEVMEKLAAAASFEDLEDHAAIENALGLAEHRRGNRAAAFAHFDKSTRISREGRPYVRADNEESARIASSWTADTFAAEPPADRGGRRPIFVTGLPRSGTTLVQQILVAHSQVDAGGELGLAMQIEALAGGFSPEDFEAYQSEGGSLDALRETYLRLVAERIPGTGAFVDKSLNQSRGLGPFSLLFPDAPVVWLRRDPLDNAWSIFRTWLSRSATGGWSLEDIAHHMKLEDDLFAHWTRELGDRLLAVPYAELVTDPDDWIDRITRHCGFEVEPGQRDFHRRTLGVTTASALQVSEPINRRGLGSAEPYRPFLKPFIQAYDT